MKASHATLTFSIFFSVLLRQGHCQPQKPKFSDITHTQIRSFTLHLERADIDEHILALARAEDANLLADASRFPKQSDLISEETTDSFGDYLLILAYQRHLTWGKIGEGSNALGTFALWSDQDVKVLARSLLNAPVPWVSKEISALEWQPFQQHQPDGTLEPKLVLAYPGEPEWQATNLSQLTARRTQEIKPLLMPYLQKNWGWKNKTTELVKGIPVKELPPDLRDNLLARLQGQMFRPRKIAAYRMWFDGEFSPLASAALYGLTAHAPQTLVIQDYAQGQIRDQQALHWNPPDTPLPRQMNGLLPQSLHLAALDTEATPTVPHLAQDTPGKFQADPAWALSPIAPPDAALQGKVSFEIKRQPLATLLRDLSTQHKVNLSVGDGAYPNAPLTARVHDLSLADTMTSLARLYCAAWVKTAEGSYQLRQSGKSDLQIKIEQLGDLDWLRYFDHQGAGPDRLHVPPITYWGPIIAPTIDDVREMLPRQKNQQRGMLVSKLPEDIQQQLRAEIQEQEAFAIVKEFRDTTAKNLARAVLVLNSTPNYVQNLQVGTDTVPFVDKAVVAVYAPGYGSINFDIETLTQDINPPALIAQPQN